MHLNSRERCALIERNLHLEKSCVRPNGSVDDRVCCLVSLSHKAVTKGCFRFFFVCVVRFCLCFCFFTHINQAHGSYRTTVAWFSVDFIYSKTGGSEKFMSSR